LSSAAADKRGPEVVQLVVVAAQVARGDEALEDVAEACEQAGRDQTDHLACERLLRAALEERALEEPRGADVVGAVLDVRGRSLGLGRVLGGHLEIVRERIVALADRT
jgi:hypothetical protein